MANLYVHNYVVHLVGSGDSAKSVTAYSHNTNIFPLIRHNWIRDLVIETTWSTQVEESYENLVEDRMGLWDRPMRSVSYNLNGSTLRSQDGQRALMQVMHHAHETLPAPLTCDKVRALYSSTSSEQTNQVKVSDIRYRRFYPGMRVAVVPQRYNRLEITGVTVDAYVATVDRTNHVPNGDDVIVFTEPLDIDVESGDFLIPMIDVEPVFRTIGNIITDNKVNYIFEVLELPGDSTLPGVAGSTLDGLFQLHTDENGETRPIFDIRPDAVSNPTIIVHRGGGRHRGGRTDRHFTRGSRPFYQFDFAVTTTSRADSWRLLEFMDWTRGRLQSFWAPHPQIQFRPVAISTDTLSVREDVTSHIQSIFNKRLFVYYTDGTIQILNIASLTNVGDGTIDIVTETNFATPSLGSIRQVTTAHLVRNTKDAFRQVWATDEFTTSVMSFVEILGEEELSLV